MHYGRRRPPQAEPAQTTSEPPTRGRHGGKRAPSRRKRAHGSERAVYACRCKETIKGHIERKLRALPLPMAVTTKKVARKLEKILSVVGGLTQACAGTCLKLHCIATITFLVLFYFIIRANAAQSIEH